MKTRKTLSLLFTLVFVCRLLTPQVRAEDGYRMWLRYDRITDSNLLEEYREQISSVVIQGSSLTINATRAELERGLGGLLGRSVNFQQSIGGGGTLVVGTPGSSSVIASLDLGSRLQAAGSEGFIIETRTVNGNNLIVIAANEEVGALYGTFHLLRLIRTHQTLDDLSVESSPKIDLRIANHWDNLDRTVERGYAGISLWDWGTLPHYRDSRYTDYARFQASIGINGAVINNVNANANILIAEYLEKVAVLADMFRPYGVKMYLSVNFFAPINIGGLETADPVEPEVQEWWNGKADEIYELIPDFGGFLVKADSEGQPGPQSYGRDHATGANMFARALEPHGGNVMWRAFVYDPSQADRFREAYDEFVPLDGLFMDNVVVQVKNGPIDFQPREPFSPLFGALEETNTMMELQVTQEYFGFATNLAYQGTLFEEALDADTRVAGEGSTVARVIDGSVHDYSLTGMAAVINPGTAGNWTGHPFVQSSWYAFGRLAWDHTLSAEEIACEWVKMTFTNDENFVDPVVDIMMISREAGVNFRDPLGLTHLPHQGDHYGPAPWHARSGCPDWTSVYYHRADSAGIGFDRTETGSNAIEQYAEPVREMFGNLETVPDDYLLWFHHVPWDHEMNSGRTLWNELVHKYYEGVEQVRWMRDTWNSLEGLIDDERFRHVSSLLDVQEEYAVWWRDSCVLYFQSHSGLPIPDQYERPEHDLEYYMDYEGYIPRF